MSLIFLQGFPAEFAMYLNYCRGLRFDEGPDYMYLRQLFRILFRTLNHQYDYTFDWTLLKQKAAASATSSSTIPALPGELVYGEVFCPGSVFNVYHSHQCAVTRCDELLKFLVSVSAQPQEEREEDKKKGARK